MLFVFFFRLNIDNGLNVPFLLLCVERAFPWAAAEAATDPTHTHTHAHTHTHTHAPATAPHQQTRSAAEARVSAETARNGAGVF